MYEGSQVNIWEDKLVGTGFSVQVCEGDTRDGMVRPGLCMSGPQEKAI